MKTFTLKEFELKEDEIFDLADKENGVILINEKGRRFMLIPISDVELTQRKQKDTTIKAGDKVIVPGEINGYGRDLQAMVTEIEKFAGSVLVTVVFTEPCPEAYGRNGGVYYDFQLNLLSE